MDILETIDAALADLDAMTSVRCGAVHERGDAKYDANVCPLRLAGNLACCHPSYAGSAAQRIRAHLSTVLRLERMLGAETIGPTPLRTELGNAEDDLVDLDDILASLHKRMGSAQVVAHPENVQMDHAARIDAVRREIVGALETLRVFALVQFPLRRTA